MSVNGRRAEHQDGTNGMIEMLVCVLVGALVGLVLGATPGKRDGRASAT